jgi:type II secretion system protein H
VAIAAAARGARGFTLVELLVVVIVIGLGAGLITLSMGHDGAARLRQESERLRGALEHAAQLAQWRRAPLVWEADAGGYRFLAATPEGLAGGRRPTLARHAFPDMRIRQAAGDHAVRPAARASGRNDPARWSSNRRRAAGRWATRSPHAGGGHDTAWLPLIEVMGALTVLAVAFAAALSRWGSRPTTPRCLRRALAQWVAQNQLAQMQISRIRSPPAAGAPGASASSGARRSPRRPMPVPQGEIVVADPALTTTSSPG